MPTAGDLSLIGLQLPLSHNPLQRLQYTSQLPYLSPAVLAAAEEKAIADFLVIFDQQTGIDLTGWWAQTVAVRNANQTFTEAIQAAITNYTDGPTFIAQCEAAWNTWIVTATQLDSAQTFSMQQFWQSLLGLNPSTALTDPAHIAGINQGETLVDTLTTGLNQLGSALGGDVADSGGWSWLANLMAGLGVNSTSPLAPIVQSAQDSAQILAIVNSEPVQQNLEATVVSSGDHKLAVALSTPISTTASLGTIVTAGQAKTFGFLQWMGEYTSAITDFVANFYLMNASGDLIHQFTTSDIGPSVPPTMAWILETITALPCAATDLIGIEFQVVTSGTVIPWGFTAPPAGAHPTALVKMAGFSQNWAGAATDIAAADINWVADSPYVGLGVGAPPPTPFFPQQRPFYASGTHTAPDWAKYVDLVLVGDGGGGEGELGGATGYGGTAGAWATQRLEVGVDISPSTVFTITVGVGGAGGPFFTAGSDGTGTTVAWTDIHGTAQTLTAAGGFGGNHTFGMSHNTLGVGLSPGDEDFQGYHYTGGGTQYLNYPGDAPGGGGEGGQPFQFGTAGARGQVWTVDRQS